MSGLTWEEFVTTRILEPLGMTHTTVRHSLAGTGVDAASPHAFVDDTVRVVSPFVGDVTNPQGGINSCAEDMARWLIVQLDSGRVAGASSLFSSSTTRALWSMATPMPIPTPVGPINQGFRGYALGFVLEDYRGEFTVSHTGSLPGYVSRIVMVPAMKLGIAVLTNQESRDAYESIVRNLLDYYLRAKPVDWIAVYKQREESRTVARQQVMARDSLLAPSLPLKRYAGLYTDPWYGDMQVSEKGNDLQIRFVQTPLLRGALVHWERDTFVARWDQRELRADAFVRFVINAFGTIDHVTMKAVSPETDFSYDFHDLWFVPTPGREK